MQCEFPILKTARLILRAIEFSDMVSIHRNLSDAQTVMYSNKNIPPSVEEVRKMIQIWQKRFEEQQGIRWGIIKLGNDDVIGSCGYKNLTLQDKKAEIGYEIFGDYRRKGLMMEALDVVIRFGFEKMYLNHIEATVYFRNIPSIRLLKNIGFAEKFLSDECEFSQDKNTNMKTFLLHDYNFY